MKNASKSIQQFTTLMKRIGPVAPPELPDADDPIAVLVLSFLMWETTTDKAVTAYNALWRHIVDFNDLRVCMPQETMEMIGVRYPRALDRCQRLRAVLRDIYAREHVVGLDSIRSLGKREIRRYIESLEGIVPYVSARVLLLSFQAHAIPVDDQLRTQLIEQGVADEGIEVPELAVWLERHIMASEGIDAHYALQAWMDAGGGAARKRTRRGQATNRKKKTTRKSTAKKATSRKTATRGKARS